MFERFLASFNGTRCLLQITEFFWLTEFYPRMKEIGKIFHHQL